MFRITEKNIPDKNWLEAHRKHPKRYLEGFDGGLALRFIHCKQCDILYVLDEVRLGHD